MGCFDYKGIRVCLIGHASVKLKHGNKIIFIDAYANPDSEEYEEKGSIILVTHEHFDHCSPDLIKKIYDSQSVIVVPYNSKCAKELKERGFKVEEMKENETKTINDVEIKAVPAYNINKPYHPRGLGVGYLVKLNDVVFYHPGDTDVIPEMQKLNGLVDVFFAPISGIYVMNEDEAKEAVEIIKPKVVIPMHYNYLEGLEKDPRIFKEKVEDAEVIIL